MGEVFFLGKRRRFTLEEARELLPVVRRVTERYIDEARRVRRRLGEQVSAELEESLNEVLRAWAEQIEVLGAEPKGLWLVDFDNGDGYYCWRYPEPQIGHVHGYEDGYRARTPL